MPGLILCKWHVWYRMTGLNICADLVLSSVCSENQSMSLLPQCLYLSLINILCWCSFLFPTCAWILCAGWQFIALKVLWLLLEDFKNDCPSKTCVCILYSVLSLIYFFYSVILLSCFLMKRKIRVGKNCKRDDVMISRQIRKQKI